MILESAISNKKLSAQYIIDFWNKNFDVDFSETNNIIVEVFKRENKDLFERVLNVALEKDVKPFVLFDSFTIKSLVDKKIDFADIMNDYQKRYIIQLEKKVLESNNQMSQEREKSRNKRVL